MSPGTCEARSLPVLSFARSAHAFRQSRKSSFGLQPAVGKYQGHTLSRFAFAACRLATSFSGIGISRSLYAFGVQSDCGLWLTLTVLADEVHVRPVRVHHFLLAHPGHEEELEPQPLLGVAGREQRIQFRLLVNLGLFFRVARPVIFPTSPRTPCDFRKPMTLANLLCTLRGACSFSSRRNAANFSRSLRSMSSTYSFEQDSVKYARAVVYAASESWTSCSASCRPRSLRLRRTAACDRRDRCHSSQHRTRPQHRADRIQFERLPVALCKGVNSILADRQPDASSPFARQSK